MTHREKIGLAALIYSAIWLVLTSVLFDGPWPSWYFIASMTTIPVTANIALYWFVFALIDPLFDLYDMSRLKRWLDK